ncbi:MULTISPECIES: GDP-mannose 4,6-dehydratase [Oerskovia]|uniref:GDP-mannose 4,6-dehydratase n=2 Tax=Oerskovia TaxID=162491 RepID=A0ABR8V3E1_9CELL|nr:MULTISPECIES: GDP-mannose 4,6-dehydratase [Oerskovia]MBD7999210.1 GDP-mannose 4,6-dehydratase [Oerskovia gallyi]MBM7498359.1 GDPmannose 4,6-dehydratase [Oerskovia paurometabola]
MTVALVTGLTGQDGSYLADRLVREGAEVHGFVRPGAAVTERAPSAGVQVHEIDLREHARMQDLLSEIAPDEVYNLGGISSVAYSWDHPVDTGLVSGIGAVTLFEAAHRSQERSGRTVRVVQASSAEIFGTPDRTPQDEGTTIRPVSPYGAAKAYAHQMAAVFRSRGLGVSSCVLYNHESPRRPETFVTRKITAGAARIAAAGGGVLALGNLDARRDWGWAPDYVDALVRAARHHEADDFVVATGEAHSVEEFVRLAFAAAGVEDWESHVEIDPRFVRPVDTAVQVGDASKAREVLGWSPTTSFREIIEKMVENDLAEIHGEAAR